MKRDPNSKRTATRKHKARMRKAPSRCIVYAIVDGDGAVRYVGQTRLQPASRMNYHRRAASPTGSPIERWLHLNAGEIKVLDGAAIWNVSEIVWIERMRARGEPLLNCNMGGLDTSR